MEILFSLTCYLILNIWLIFFNFHYPGVMLLDGDREPFPSSWNFLSDLDKSFNSLVT